MSESLVLALGRKLVGEGDTRRRLPDVRLGDGEEKTSSFSTGIVLGEGLLGLSMTLFVEADRPPPEGIRLVVCRNGLRLTNSPFARPFNPIEALGVLFPHRKSGLSFSLLAETFLSPPDALLSPDTVGKATFFSLDTLLVPLIADPLGVRLADLGRCAVIPSPIAVLGVDDIPTAFSGDCPSCLNDRRSCMTRSFPVKSTCKPRDCCPCTVSGLLNGELDTKEFLVTCLKLDDDRLGEALVLKCSGVSGVGEGLRGEVTESRLLI